MVSKHELSESLSEVLDDAVAVLLPNVNLSDPAPSLSSAFDMARSAMAMTFCARIALRIAKRTKLLSHFEDIASLLQGLPRWRASSPKAHMLYAFLQLLRVLERYDQATPGSVAGTVVADILDPLKTKAGELFGQATLGNTSFAELRLLQNDSAILDILEPALFDPRFFNTSWQSDIRGHVTRCATLGAPRGSTSRPARLVW